MSSPEIAVVIPAYNQAQFLPDAIDSVLGQSFINFELVVVDDGSTDETPQVLASIRDPRVRVVRQKNAGLAGARNTGIRETSAPLLTFLDSDDLFMPDSLAVLHAYLQQHPDVGLVSGGRKLIGPDGTVLREITRSTGHELKDLLLNNPFAVGSWLLRRDWVDRVGVFDPSLRALEDWDLYLRLSLAGCRMAWIGGIMMAYRFHPAQMTREVERMRTSRLAVLDKFFARTDLPEEARALRDQATAAILVKVALLAFMVGSYDVARTDLATAISLDPTLRANEYQRFINALMGWAFGPHVADPTAFMVEVQSHLPESLRDMQRPLRRAIAKSLLQPMFAGPPEARRTHKATLLKALWYDPTWLLNRGVLRMLVEAWLPFGMGFAK